MLRWFYIGLGCLLAATAIYVESIRRTGAEPGRLAGGLPALALPGLRLTSAGTPVLVFHLASAEAVAGVRAAVSAERIVAETPAGFALAEGRIVAAGHEATAALLAATGWSDRPLEIHRAEPRLPDYRSHGPFPSGTPRGAAGPDALAHKSHLTRPEAMAVMERLD
jgi:hypothetical protein